VLNLQATGKIVIVNRNWELSCAMQTQKNKMSPTRSEGWVNGELPWNVNLGSGTTITGAATFQRFLAQGSGALTIGNYSCAVEVGFAVGPQGRIRIGNYCYLNACTLLAEQELRIGNFVMIGWGTTVSDTDFHPLDPAERIRDAIALSPISNVSRPRIEPRPVVIADDVFVGPACTILKGITIGRGAFVEPGSVITRDVPSHARVCGNPAVVIQEKP
jgi:acetyltransferase-like isoleucine patch superfamily enzyme